MTEFEALLASAAIEGPVAYLLVRLTRWPCRGPLQAAFAVMLATAATHPQLWAASLWSFPRFGYWPTMAVTEGAVVVVEAAIVAWVAALSPRRALAVSAPSRTEDLPDVPTMKEAGADLDAVLWSGIFAPRQTPGAIVQKLERELARIVHDPDVVAQFKTLLRDPNLRDRVLRPDLAGLAVAQGERERLEAAVADA